MSTVTLDVEAVRARFSALRRPYAFFDAPGGTQVPDEVVDAIAQYLREDNANLGGAFETSRRSDAVVTAARLTAARFLGCTPDEVAFGQNMTTLNFALTRTVARSFREGDEVVVTRLDHDGNVAPWLELQHDMGLVVRFAELDDQCRLDLNQLASLLSERTRVVAFPWAANSVGTLVDVVRVAELAHATGALAWVDAVHYAPHGPIDVVAAGADVLLCSPYKFYGPHMGLGYVRQEVAESWRPYKVRPAPEAPVGARFETGTLAHELLAGFVACVEYIEGVGWQAIQTYEHALAEQFLAGLPDHCHLYGVHGMSGRVPTYAFNVEGMSPDAVATRLGERGFAVWHGDYYAAETMKFLGLEDGAVRVGLVHYNTADEVDRLLEELAGLG